jgi:hypothetical protein
MREDERNISIFSPAHAFIWDKFRPLGAFLHILKKYVSSIQMRMSIVLYGLNMKYGISHMT